MADHAVVASVVTDSLGDLIVDLLQRLEGPARQAASLEVEEMVSALSDWTETQGTADVVIALGELRQRLEGKTFPTERFRLRTHLG